jgi:hypothetical protein
LLLNNKLGPESKEQLSQVRACALVIWNLTSQIWKSVLIFCMKVYQRRLRLSVKRFYEVDLRFFLLQRKEIIFSVVMDLLHLFDLFIF